MSFLDRFRATFNSASENPDERLRAVLREQGDDGSKTRMVDHLVCFNNDEDAQAFVEFVLSRGFTLGESDEEHCVAFSRESAVVGDEFNIMLATLREKADEMNGQYDGWGCSVVL